jgi:leucyl aminopeptidase
MQWKGGDPETPPLALVGKGVCFDTGGISIKPAGGMEDMTMDMGGAAVVAGVMRTLALRRAKANVVGLVGLVENMPSGTAQRPGDIVRSMKGDTIEVINTDAEGRLVLADVLWYAYGHDRSGHPDGRDRGGAWQRECRGLFQQRRAGKGISGRRRGRGRGRLADAAGRWL